MLYSLSEAGFPVPDPERLGSSRVCYSWSSSGSMVERCPCPAKVQDAPRHPLLMFIYTYLSGQNLTRGTCERSWPRLTENFSGNEDLRTAQQRASDENFPEPEPCRSMMRIAFGRHSMLSEINISRCHGGRRSEGYSRTQWRGYLFFRWMI